MKIVIILSFFIISGISKQFLLLAPQTSCSNGACFEPCPLDWVEIDQGYCIKKNILNNHQTFTLSPIRSGFCLNTNSHCQCAPQCPLGYQPNGCQCKWKQQLKLQIKKSSHPWIFALSAVGGCVVIVLIICLINCCCCGGQCCQGGGGGCCCCYNNGGFYDQGMYGGGGFIDQGMYNNGFNQGGFQIQGGFYDQGGFNNGFNNGFNQGGFY